MEVPPDSLQREEVSKNDLGRRSPWWGGRKEGTSDLKHSWSQFLVGFIHPVWWHPPDDGRLSMVVAVAGCKQHQQLAWEVVEIFTVLCRL